MRSNNPDTLRRFFSGLTEYAFMARLGVADMPLIEYVTALLIRFVRCDAVYRIRDLSSRRLEDIAMMLIEGEERIGEARREVHRHVGDFALFWTGLYPEALGQTKDSVVGSDFFQHYCQQGKRSYYIASTIPAEDDSENEILRRLSDDFEMCVYGLGEIRREWDRREPGGSLPDAN